MGFAVLGIGLAGCTQRTTITGEGLKESHVIRGELGISGEDNEVTLLAGSDVSKLSIMGQDIDVVVEEGATVRKIEVVGEDNTVRCPPGLAVDFSTIGEDNKLYRR